eukprot:Seg658.7 transcript_id=Seg658.7/GoldUCD/mRNA.D3Y31 product="Mitochondrial import inner membrane translocase subunit Tim21" protein_id=Seg658.7/GoldUCD/D3Y31
MRTLRLLLEPQLSTKNAIGSCRILCSLPAAHLGQHQLQLHRLRISVPHIRRVSAFCFMQRNERNGVTFNKNHDGIYEHLLLKGTCTLTTLKCKRQFSIIAPIYQMRKQSHDEIVEAAPLPQDGQLTVGQKVKQAGKDASYMGVLLVGFGVTGVLIWYVLSELLFSFSPNSVYSKALKKVKHNQAVLDAVGDSFKAYGEETSRGRRRHVSHQDYIVDGGQLYE